MAQETTLPEKVRASCAAAAAVSRQVRVAAEKVAEYALGLPLENPQWEEHDAAAHYLGHGADTVAFFLTLDSINFGSGWFPHLRKRAGLSGYFTVATGLAERFRNHGTIPAAALAGIRAAEVAAMLGQDPAEGEVGELMALFARALRDLGTFVAGRFGGSFTAVVEEAAGSAARLAEILAQMPFYRDVEEYGGREVHFYKRAQIASQDLALAFGGEGWGRFHDLDRLTIFADNLVPHVLRVDGILDYDPELAARIDREELIPAGSPEEVEIRACGVHAVELMAQALAAAGRPRAPREIDFFLWNRGQDPRYKKNRPRHRTRTVFY